MGSQTRGVIVDGQAEVSPKGVLAWFDDLFACLFSGLMAVTSAAGFGAFAYQSLVTGTARGITWGLLCLPMVALGLVWLRCIILGWREGVRPAMVVAAMRQPRWPIGLHAPVGLVFILAFLAGAFTATMIQVIARDEPDGIVMLPVVFLYTYAANGTLLMGIGAWTRNEQLLSRLWRHRIVLDLLIAAIALAFGQRMWPSYR